MAENETDKLDPATRRKFMGGVISAAGIGFAGCMGIHEEDMSCTGDCDTVEDWGVDVNGGGFGSSSTSATVKFTDVFTGTVAIAFYGTDGLVAGDEKQVNARTVVNFQFDGSMGGYEAELTVSEADSDERYSAGIVHVLMCGDPGLTRSTLGAPELSGNEYS